MSNITNINEQRYDNVAAASNQQENQLISDDYNSPDEYSESGIKAEFDKIIEALKRGDVYNSKRVSSDFKIQ